MKSEFLKLYDKISNLAAPGYEDDEISYFLSEAQERIVKTHIHPRGNKYKEGFEETEKRRKELSGLLSLSTDQAGVLKTTISTNQEGKISPNSVFYNLPEDFWLSTTEWVITNDTCNSRKKVIPVTHDEYEIEIDNPFKKPSDKLVWRLDVNRDVNANEGEGLERHELITDGTYTITEYHVRYIKRLSDIIVDETNPNNNVNCVLHPMFHREIVNLAVEIALETSQEPRWQSNKQQNLTNE
jgi:hypothetical protein